MNHTLRILVFLQGTILMHQSALGRARAERVQQVRNGDPSVNDLTSYVPVGNAVAKLRAWSEQGAEIVYLSAHRKPQTVEQDKRVLQEYGFPDGPILFSSAG